MAAARPALDSPDFGPRYRVEKTLGEGGMGIVYKALDLQLNRAVALKLVRSGLADDPQLGERFKQELLLASKVTHKNVLRIHDLGEYGGRQFISMAYIEGEDLHQVLLREGRLSVERAINIARQICAALEAAHAEGVVHRDLKPQNMLLDAAGNIYVTDFGLAKSLEDGLTGMTRSGEMLGTPRYMAPEQILGKGIDHRVDIYALGLILYEMVSGDVPFRADSTMQLLYNRVHEAPKSPKIHNPDLPDWIVHVIMKCIERDPDKRYQTAAEVLQDLETARAPKSQSRTVQIALPSLGFELRRIWLIAVVAVLLTAGIVAIPSVRHRIFDRAVESGGPQKPITVLVADFTNHTGDPVFDGTLEPMLNTALEGASYINAYNRGTARKLAKKLPHPTDNLDEQSARLVAVGQSINVVITGEITLRGNQYDVSAIALDAMSGSVLTNASITASNQQKILREIPALAANIRKALGDTTPDSVQYEAIRGAFNVGSLAAVHQLNIGAEEQLAGKYEEALQSFSKAVQLDPNFATAYAGMASVAWNLGKQQDAEKYMKLAMENEDRMTERERYRYRASYYLNREDWQKCVEENSEIVKRYPADRNGPLNLAVCYVQLRNVPQALEAARRAVEIDPKSALQRFNLSFIDSFGGDFQAGEREARTALQLSPAPLGYFSLAEAQLGQGQLSQAAETYHNLEKLGPLASSMASSGLADLAAYQGHYTQAAGVLEQAVAADLAAKRPENAASKLAALAHVQLALGQTRAAVATAEKALAYDQAFKIRFLASRIFVEAGEVGKAQKLAAVLGSELKAEPQSYAKIIDGMIAVKRNDTRQAIAALDEATRLLDTWIARFELARIYLDAGLFVDADSQLDRCIKRRGEALEFFLDNSPTYSYVPDVYYYQGRVREGLKSPGFADSYRTYLSIRGQAGEEDPRLPEIRHRLGQ